MELMLNLHATSLNPFWNLRVFWAYNNSISDETSEAIDQRASDRSLPTAYFPT
jgi:hypothetical protein